MFNPSTGLRAAVCRNAGKGFQRIHSGLFFLKGLCDVRDNYTCRTLLCYSLENLDIIKVKLDKQSAQFKKKQFVHLNQVFVAQSQKLRE